MPGRGITCFEESCKRARRRCREELLAFYCVPCGVRPVFYSTYEMIGDDLVKSAFWSYLGKLCLSAEIALELKFSSFN
jgi:hypothetical protein